LHSKPGGLGILEGRQPVTLQVGRGCKSGTLQGESLECWNPGTFERLEAEAKKLGKFGTCWVQP